MADLGSSLKTIFMKGMESIGNAATSIANNTKSKVDEMNMVNRRTEILADFGNRAYGLWLKGENFPQELNDLLKELKELDEKLNDLRTEKYANIKQKSENKEAPVLRVEKTEEIKPVAEPEEENGPEEKEAEAVPVIRVEKKAEDPQSPVSAADAIEDLFNKIPDSGEVNEKVNEALDSIGDSMNRISKEIDQGLDQLTDKMNSGDK